MLTLGIETSCDETAVAVLDGSNVRSHIVSSSVHLHARYGGVVPEIASRHHLEYIGYCLRNALKKATVNFKDLELVSVTQGPGLMGSLLVGVSVAKAISFALNIPIVGVDHVLGHLWSVFLNGNRVRFPFIGFILSGGHTSILYVTSLNKYVLLGQTRDDACGESFDKVAKILKLGYPGGPVIERRARSGDPQRIRFPRSYLGSSFDFSFSGIKTAVLYHVRDYEKNGTALNRGHIDDVAASFQEAVFDVVVTKALAACTNKGCRRLVVGGGVSANKRLRQRLAHEAKAHNVTVHIPPQEYCLDNAAMVAYLGQALYKSGVRSNLDFTAYQYSSL
jgi:N6-L-threonylcarbamoyladenine synthase